MNSSSQFNNGEIQSLFPSQNRAPSLSALNWKRMGKVRGLYERITKELTPRRVTQALAITNYGLAGDRHASLHSPRQILLAGEASYQKLQLPEASLRENILIDLRTAALCSGDLLSIGAEAVFWITFHCEPCHLLEQRCPGTLKTIGRHRGVLARVLRGGVIRHGDEIWTTKSSIPVMSNDWQHRVLKVVQSIPLNHHISYRFLAQMAGVTTSYCRAFPRVLARLPSELASRVHSASKLQEGTVWSGTEFFDVSNFLHLPSEERQATSANPSHL
jgi:MOSC domain-containing protein YiiM